jgi:hypothetical protein
MHKQLLSIKSIIMKEGGGAKRGNEEKITRRKEKDLRRGTHVVKVIRQNKVASLPVLVASSATSKLFKDAL